MLLWVNAWQVTRLNLDFICLSVNSVVAVNATSAALLAGSLPAGPAVSVVCAQPRAPWSIAPACAASKACSITVLPRTMRTTALTDHAPALQPTPVLAGAQWVCWHSVCRASAATPLPGCALRCASVLTTGPHGPAAGAATPTPCAARFLLPTLILGIPRYATKLQRSRYDRPG